MSDKRSLKNMSNNQRIILEAQVEEQHEGQRLDFIASEIFSDYSRSRLQKWIKNGELTVDGKVLKAKEKLFTGQTLRLDAELAIEVEDDKPQAIELDVVYEDESVLVINKPAGLVVHPAAGHKDSTLLNGLLYHCPELVHVPRAGIVHRLDKETTGLMMVAKTLPAHNALVEQLQERSVLREYLALVQGVVTAGASVDAMIDRHPNNRQKQAVVTSGGKEAITHYRVEQRFRAQSLLRCQLETGRTHQIRVHMAHVRLPLVGDKLYGGRPKLPKAAAPELVEALQQFNRQALHACRLGIIHPETGEYCEWQSELPADMANLLQLLKEDLNEQNV